jgi:hypothetical protein
MTRLNRIQWSVTLIIWPWVTAAFVTWNHGTRIA